MLELLVALSIIALLAAISLPAIQAARESSRRAACVAREANLGRALHAFEAAHRRFPPAVTYQEQHPQTGGPGSDHHHAPHVYLLPFLEQHALARQIDLSVPFSYVWDPATLRQELRMAVPAFVCPADAGTGGNNYRACTGQTPYATDSRLAAPHEGGQGVFAACQRIDSASIRDGLSNTIAFSEKLKSPAPPARPFAPEDFWYSGLRELLGDSPPTDEVVAACASLSGSPRFFQPHCGGTWAIAGYDYTWYNHALPPNARTYDCSVDWINRLEAYSFDDGVYKASSRHSGGVHSLFADGHVQFVSDAIDLRVWRAMATRASGD